MQTYRQHLEGHEAQSCDGQPLVRVAVVVFDPGTLVHDELLQGRPVPCLLSVDGKQRKIYPAIAHISVTFGCIPGQVERHKVEDHDHASSDQIQPQVVLADGLFLDALVLERYFAILIV